MGNPSRVIGNPGPHDGAAVLVNHDHVMAGFGPVDTAPPRTHPVTPNPAADTRISGNVRPCAILPLELHSSGNRQASNTAATIVNNRTRCGDPRSERCQALTLPAPRCTPAAGASRSMCQPFTCQNSHGPGAIRHHTTEGNSCHHAYGNWAVTRRADPGRAHRRWRGGGLRRQGASLSTELVRSGIMEASPPPKTTSCCQLIRVTRRRGYLGQQTRQGCQHHSVGWLQVEALYLPTQDRHLMPQLRCPGLMEATLSAFHRPRLEAGFDGNRWLRTRLAGCGRTRSEADAGCTNRPTLMWPAPAVRWCARAVPAHQLRLVQADHRLGQRVVVAALDGAGRAVDPRDGKRCGVTMKDTGCRGRSGEWYVLHGFGVATVPSPTRPAADRCACDHTAATRR